MLPIALMLLICIGMPLGYAWRLWRLDEPSRVGCLAVAAEAICIVALAWCLRQPNVTSCIIGATRPEQVEDNVEASGIVLDDQTIRRVEEAVRAPQ